MAVFSEQLYIFKRRRYLFGMSQILIKMAKTITLILSMLLFAACGNDKPNQPAAPPAPVIEQQTESPKDVPEEKTEEIEQPVQPAPPAAKPEIKSSSGSNAGAGAGRAAPAPVTPITHNDASSVAKNGFSDVASLDPSIKLDIRYATADNFTKSKIYDCPRCLLRPEAAKAIVKAHKALQKKGFGLKMFDCYRPRPYQQRLWDKVPNPDYVTPPAKGSMHSRGAAVDLTLVDKNGKELDMGTPYDFFGKAAHTDNTNLPAQVLANRKLLREALEAVGFKGIRTEWWHFSYQGKDYPLSDYVWPCGEKK